LDTFSQIGGARIGHSFWRASNATLPFAYLKATPQTLTLRVLLKQYTFEKQTIRQLKLCQGIFSTGLQIVHAREDYPTLIVFWTLDFKGLKSGLQKLGVSVEDNSS
jgi:hypothetical protein